MDTKICRTCGETKPLTDFYLSPHNTGGRKTACKVCSSRYQAEYHKAQPNSPARWRAKNPEKYRAHRKVKDALAMGHLIKPTTCSSCGAGGTIDGHHPDYSKPLEVIWLCRPCHMALHRA